MSVPKLTIPETAFDPSFYTSRNRQSRLLTYLVKLTNGSAIALIVIYLVGYFGIKPLLELTLSRRLDLLDKCRHRLRDIYLLLISKVDEIPIIGLNKNDGKIYCDAIVQTDETGFKDSLAESQDKLKQNELSSRMHLLKLALENCNSYSSGEMHHYKVARDAIKHFQSRVDTKIFDYDDLISIELSNGEQTKKKNLMVAAKNDIRSMKGQFMSGKA